MQELVGRLTALDPEASETLKVVSYFDALVAAGVGLEALLRGAAVLSGTVAGAELRGRIARRDPTGARATDAATTVRSPSREVAGGSVWIERDGAHHANDEMVVERLALAVELVESRRTPEGVLDVAIDAARTPAERAAALGRLRITPETRVCVVARPGPSAAGGGLTTLVATPYGILRAILDTDGAPDSSATPAPAGIGTWVRADRLPESWDAAVAALRLTDARHPVVDATELGALVLLARDYDPEHPPEDVVALARLDDRALEVLAALVEADSARAAATALGMHHSTVQSRYESLCRELGYDPRSALGRSRFTAAELLLRLSARTPASGRSQGG